MHVADSANVTVGEAGEKWIASAEVDDPERSTVAQYRQHLDIHIKPFIGSTKLSQLTVPAVREFQDRLRIESRSAAMVRKVVRSLGSLLADAQEQGLVAHNPVRERARKRRRGEAGAGDTRHKKRLEVGVDIPINAEIKAMVHALNGRWRSLLITAIFTGLRASELRGLTWNDVDFDNRVVYVRQRADRYNKIGPPKSNAGQREVPLPPMALNTLREWKLECPKGDLGLVFPNGKGNVESLANIINRGLIPAQKAAGVVVKDGGDTKAKYTGKHALRHFYASWCVNREKDGGIGLPPKIVQARIGHSSITMTMDV